MYKRLGFILTVIVCSMVFVACGSDKVENANTYEKNETTELLTNTEQTEQKDDVTTMEENKDNNVLTDDEIESARQVALNYYNNTVFEVVSMTYIERSNCQFRVSVSKNGEVQEMDRTIELKNKDGVWEVLNEGY